VLREGFGLLSQALMESEVAGLIGPSGTSGQATARATATGPDADLGHAGGTIELRFRRSGQGPTVVAAAARRRPSKALLPVVQEAYVHACRRAKVDER